MLPVSRAGMQVPHVVRAVRGDVPRCTDQQRGGPGWGGRGGERAGPCVEPVLLFGFRGRPRGGAETEGDVSFAVGGG